MLKVRKASYNGIDFNVQSTDVAGGHRQSEHQFNNNKTGLQQHGVKNRTYTLSALHFGVDSVKQANNLIDQLEKSGAGVLMHPDYGELAVGFDTFSTGVNTKRNMVVTKLNFLQDSDVNLLSVDYQGLLVETIAQTALQVINSTVSAITTSSGKFEAIIDLKQHINSDIELDNMDVILGHVLESVPLTFSSNNPITQTFSQQHQALSVATNSIDKLKHQLGSEVGDLSTSIHPLFSDNEVQYVS